MTRRRGAWGLLRRRARADLTSLVALGVLVLVTATLVAMVPRVLAGTADQAVRAAVDTAPREQLEVTASTTNDEGVDQLDRVDRQIRRGLSLQLQELVDGSGRGATTSLYDTFDISGALTREKPFARLQLRHQPGALDEVRWVRGRAPRSPAASRSTVGTAEGETVAMLEVALARSAARQLDLRAGQTVVLEPLDPPAVGDGTTAVRVVGLFEVRDPEDEAWSYAPLVTSPGAEYSADGQLTSEYAAALVDTSQLAALSDASPVLRYDWHYPLAAGRVDAENAASVLADLRATVARGAFVPADNATITGSAESVAVASGLVDLLETYVERADATESLVALVLVGMLAVGLAVLGLAGLVVVGRRAAGAALVRARGASRLGVTAASLLEVACFVVPAAALGWLVSELAGGSRGGGAAAAAVALVAAVSLGVVGWVTWREERRAGRSRVSARLVAEVVVGVVAVLGVLEVRRGGVGEDGADPVLVLVPVLVVVAVALVALRLLPVVLRWTSRRAAPAPGLLPFLGVARAARQPLAVAVPLSTLLLGLGFAVFAAGVTSTVNDGQRSSAWQEVGADLRLDAEFFEGEDVAAVEDVDGVEAVVPALRRERAKIYDPSGAASYGSALVVDATAYADVLAMQPDADVDVQSLRELAGPVGDDEPLPALATTGAAEVLETHTGTIDPTASLGLTDVRVVAAPTSFLLDEGSPSVVLDLPSVQARESFPIRPNTLLVQGEPDALAEVVATAERFSQEVRASDRRATLGELRGSPFVGSTQALFTIGTVTAAVYCVLGLVLVLVLNARSRARLAGTLRMLGAPARQVGRLAVLEIAPLVLVMVLAGAAAGVLLVRVLLPGVDLVPLTGGVAPPEPVVGIATTALLAVGLLLLVALTVLGLSAVEGRRRVGETLREEEET
jgi:putative ABC transport system permease protein